MNYGGGGEEECFQVVVENRVAAFQRKGNNLMFFGVLAEGQGQNLAVTVLYVPHSPDSGKREGIRFQGCGTSSRSDIGARKATARLAANASDRDNPKSRMRHVTLIYRRKARSISVIDFAQTHATAGARQPQDCGKSHRSS